MTVDELTVDELTVDELTIDDLTWYLQWFSGSNPPCVLAPRLGKQHQG